jgi:hypothetical protein
MFEEASCQNPAAALLFLLSVIQENPMFTKFTGLQQILGIQFDWHAGN